MDKDEREKIIGNPNDILTFFTDIGYKKRVQGYNVLKALTEAYYFVSGFNFLINEGELSGAGLLIDKEDSDMEIKDNKDSKEEEIKSDSDTEVNDINNDNENKKEDKENADGIDLSVPDDTEIDENATDI